MNVKLSSRAPVLDAVIAAAAFAGTLLAIFHGGGVAAAAVPLDGVRIVLAACATLPLLLWRRWPLGVFVATAAASVVLAGAGSAGGFTPGPATALFLLAGSRTRQAPWTGRTTLTVVGMFAAYAAALGLSRRSVEGIELLHASLAWSVGWFAGERSRLRREQIVDLSQRAERERQLALVEERARIARDLHDSAGHAINVIAVRAGAARLHGDPARSRAALVAIEELARETAGEIDQIVGGLRDPVPAGLASLETLVRHHVDAGLAVSLSRDGDPSNLSRAADQAVYRVVQEALTNAARHGEGAAEVTLNFAEAETRVAVTNPVAPDRVPGSGGHGLIGMRERVSMLGGRVHAGADGGTFRVDVVIPVAVPRL